MERGGWGSPVSTQNLLDGLTFPHRAVPRPAYTSLTMPSRSIADDTACRNLASPNHSCLAAIFPSLREVRSLRLKTRKLYSRLGPRSERSIFRLADCLLSNT